MWSFISFCFLKAIFLRVPRASNCCAQYTRCVACAARRTSAGWCARGAAGRQRPAAVERSARTKRGSGYSSEGVAPVASAQKYPREQAPGSSGADRIHPHSPVLPQRQPAYHRQPISYMHYNGTALGFYLVSSGTQDTTRTIKHLGIALAVAIALAHCAPARSRRQRPG